MVSRARLVVVLLLALVATACSEGPGAGGPLEGTQWIVRSLAVDGALTLVEEQFYADADFSAQRVSGRSGCNTYEARYRAGGRTLFVSPPAGTLMACDEATMTFEQAFLANLAASRFYTASRTTLTIYGAARETLLVFDASPRNPLLGPWVVDSFETAPNSLSIPLEGTELDVAFGLTSVHGSAGCNNFDGTYNTNGNVVRIGRLATTRMACEQDVMDQETTFLDALQGVAFLDRTSNTTLNLTDRNGSLVVALKRPETEEAASPAPSGEPSASPTATPSPTPSPTASPTPSPSPSPTAAPTATPSPSPAPSATAAPTAAPTSAPSIPPIDPDAACDLVVGDATYAALAYPSTWFTVTTPADLACRYFDPAPITVPADPATLTAAITVQIVDTAYADAVAAATDASVWTVKQTASVDVDSLPATAVAAVAAADSAGIPVGQARVAYFIDYGAAGTMILSTVGPVGNETLVSNATVLGLMVQASTFTAPG